MSQKLQSFTEQKENPESKELFHIEPIEGTPFKIVNDDKRAFLTLANYRVSEDYQTPDEVRAYWEGNFWEILLKVITIINQIIQITNENSKTNPENLDSSTTGNHTNKPEA